MPSGLDYLILAERDRKFSLLGEKEFPDEYAVNGAAYHIQQAIEKLLKGLILINGETPEFTHDITKLYRHAKIINIDLPVELEDVADSLTLWATKTRYDPSVCVLERKYSIAIEVYEKLHLSLKNIIDQITHENEDGFDDYEDEQSRGR